MPTNVGIQGERDQGKDVRTNNVTAITALANIVKSSLGPQGLDKMLVDEIGDVTITNDGATILRQLEVEHPAAQVIVELSQLQDKEVGDGTTSVVILASEFLKRADHLYRNKVHPTSIIQGFKMAIKESCQFIKEHLAVPVSSLGKEALVNVAKTSMSSKIIGSDAEFFANLAVDAILAVKTTNFLGESKYPVKSINVLKSQGKSSSQSLLVSGYALQTMRASQQMVTKIENAKIALIDFNLNKFRMNLGIQVVIDDPKNLEKVRWKECEILKERIQKIIDAGANVIITSKGMDDYAQKYLVEKGILGLRRVDKHDLRKIAKSSGATIVTSLAGEEGVETFDSTNLGICGSVYEEAVGDSDFIFFKDFKKQQCSSIIIRGANDIMCDEIERSIHDSLCVVKRTLECEYVVPGGGACEVALAIKLEDYAKTLGSKEQTAIAEFSEALTVIPKVLASNAAQDSIELLSQLRALHYRSQTTDSEEEKKYKYCGLDLIKGKIKNNLNGGVLEPMVSKIKCLRFATEAAITILRIDDMIKLEPKREEHAGRTGPMSQMQGMPMMG